MPLIVVRIENDTYIVALLKLRSHSLRIVLRLKPLHSLYNVQTTYSRYPFNLGDAVLRFCLGTIISAHYRIYMSLC